MTEEKLERAKQIKTLLAMLSEKVGDNLGSLNAIVNDFEPYYKEVQEIIKNKRRAYVDQLKKEFDEL